MNYAIEVALVVMMCRPSFKKNGPGGRSVLRFCFNNMRGSVYNITCMSVTLDGDLVRILDFGIIDRFNTQLVITLNYSAIANFHTLQITRTHAKSFTTYNVFTSSCLVTASNNGYSPASVLKFSLNGGSLPV
jgi:hypothetical protein